MGYIVDLSKHQPSKNINWSVFSKQVDLLILRVQYGSAVPDSEYANHVSNAKKFNIPFMTYAFPEFVSVDDARVEARDAVKRQDKDSKAMIIDIEAEYDKNKKPVGITKLSKDVRLNGIKAYVDELRKCGVKKVGAYIAHNVYEPWGINTIVNIFDFIWIARYGADDGKPNANAKPKYPCDLWQYTSVGRVEGYNDDLDLNMLIGNKTLDWFIGGQAQTASITQNTTNTGGIRMYQPSNTELMNATLRVLGRLSQKDPNGISKDWYTKAQKGEIPLDDVVGLLYVALDRGLIQGSGK
ncbi:GH25 family lysozyme [Bacillus smithii]|uniref:GH25 family lysozyme n=1 Tax=Bacillus smithii TaxID=1479 RepID=UPI003D1FB1C3